MAARCERAAAARRADARRSRDGAQGRWRCSASRCYGKRQQRHADSFLALLQKNDALLPKAVGLNSRVSSSAYVALMPPIRRYALRLRCIERRRRMTSTARVEARGEIQPRSAARQYAAAAAASRCMPAGAEVAQ